MLQALWQIYNVTGLSKMLSIKGRFWYYMGTTAQISGLEIRKILSYRFDFWSSFLGGVLIEVALSYFVWSSIYNQQNTRIMAGYDFVTLMYYCTITPILTQISQSQTMHFISEDIYQGGLNRYIIYPLNYMHYKLVAHFSFCAIGFLQLFLALSLLFWIWGAPVGVSLSTVRVLFTILSILLGTLLYFLLAACLEMVAFWADNVWSLNVMLRFLVRLFGGALVPLSFFPEWAHQLIYFLPFWGILGLPTEIALSKISLQDALHAEAITCAWISVVALACYYIWNEGRKKYTGVGI